MKTLSDIVEYWRRTDLASQLRFGDFNIQELNNFSYLLAQLPETQDTFVPLDAASVLYWSQQLSEAALAHADQMDAERQNALKILYEAASNACVFFFNKV